MRCDETHLIMFKTDLFGFLLFNTTPFIHSFKIFIDQLLKTGKCSKCGVMQVVKKKKTNVTTFMETTFF